MVLMHIQTKLNYNLGLMIIKHEIISRYEDYEFKIPYSSSDKVLVKPGQKVKVGDNIFEKKQNSKVYTFYVPSQIPISAHEVEKYITCIDGELVKEGDVLLEKEVTGGLNIKKLVSPIEGVVDLSRVGSGYIDILGEESSSIFKSSFTGEVVDVNLVDGIIIKARVSAMDIKALSKMYQKEEEGKIFGEFVVIGDGVNLQVKADQDDYTNKIVFAGKYLHTSLLQDLFEKGAAFVLTYSMDYADFRKQTLPLGVLGGFGEISCGNEILTSIGSKNSSLCFVDLDESQIFFLSSYKSKSGKGNFVKDLMGSTVRSLSLSNYSMIGKIIDMEEGEAFVTVEWENGSKGIINIGAVEFISL